MNYFDTINFEESIQIKDLTFSYIKMTYVLDLLNLKIKKVKK